MNAMHIVILLTAIICQISAKTPIQNNSLTYECTKDDTIIITGKDQELYGSIYALGTIKNVSKSMCKVDRFANASLVAFTIKECNVSQPVIITVMKESQNTTDDMVLGGQKVMMYELKCSNVRRGGLILNNSISINETDTMSINQTHQNEVNMTMKLLDKGNNTLGTNSTCVIGDELQLVIVGNGGFAFLASSCIATDGTGTSAHTKNLIVNGTTQDASVISTFSEYGDSNHIELKASLYAFHFLNTNNISILCTITVCQDDDNSCPFNTKEHRGKRSAHIEPHKNTLKTSFRVMDSYIITGDKTGNLNTSAASSGRISVTAFLILFVAFGFAKILP